MSSSAALVSVAEIVYERHRSIRDSMDCDLVCSAAWIAKFTGPDIRPALIRKNATAPGSSTWLHDDPRQLIDTMDNLRQLAKQRLQLLQPRMQVSSLLELKIG